MSSIKYPEQVEIYIFRRIPSSESFANKSFPSASRGKDSSH
jgi:hypothetical protein